MGNSDIVDGFLCDIVHIQHNTGMRLNFSIRIAFNLDFTSTEEYHDMTASPGPPPSYDEATGDGDGLPRRLPPIQHQHMADMSGMNNEVKYSYNWKYFS